MNNLITLHQCNEKLKIFKNVFSWEQCEVGNLFEITRGETLAKKFITNFKTRKNIYPVYSSQTTNNGLMGYYKTYLFENAITWTTDGCYAGNFNYRPEKFYSTNVNGVLISNNGYANYAVSEIINSVAQKYVTKTVNPKLMSNVVNQIKFFAPKIKEQIKISNFIFNLNNLITLHQKKLDLLKKFKKTLLEKMFSLNEESFPKIRFNGFFDAWEQCKVIDLLNFIRPDKYIVQNEKYIKGALTPVLTANKSFIIGHTKEKKTFKKNCIIFDDFTLNIKYVNFPFMVKSSVIKILIETENNNLFFIYLLLKNKNFKPFGHMSHYVNFVQNISLEKIKNKEEQDKIAKLFSKIYNLITLHRRKEKT
ncbi:restriction endonuclease subunit S [Mycoplasmopsis synoviae]|uniref:restriction endonuclease subunit S n=1 Tax=Mycoplasmopsis synoviae TaxID=2109 RepID=UPI003567870E